MEGMLKYLGMMEKQLTRDLWEEAFPDDSTSFGDYYYRMKVHDNRILAEIEEGQVQAMIHLNPYVLQVRERRWRVDYLVGVATRRNKRHQGYMRRLLLQMMADMREEQMPFCFLMPADEAIYRPFGFTFIFRQPQWQLKKDGKLSQPLIRRVVMGQAENRQYLCLLAEWMNRWLKERYQVFALRDTTYLLRLAEELGSEAGTLEVLLDGQEMAGMQAWWGTGQKEQRLLYCREAYVEEAAPAKPAIMARIITPELFIRVIRLNRKVKETELVIPLFLEDALIPENHGDWNWHLTREGSWLERAKREGAPAKEELRLTIEELTAWLFGYEIPEAAGAWSDKVETIGPVFLDEVV